MTNTTHIYDNRPPNSIGPQITHRDQAIGNRGPNTAAERLACAAVLYRNGCRDLLPMLGLTDD